MEKPKRKGMLDLIKANGAGESVQAGLDEARKIADRVVTFKPKDIPPKRSTLVSPKDHHRITMILIKEQYRISMILISYQDHIRIISRSPKDHHPTKK